jgi:hypothetical protein
MIHAKDEASCREIARKISHETSVNTYKVLFSRKELKKTSMQYFSEMRSEKREINKAHCHFERSEPIL